MKLGNRLNLFHRKRGAPGTDTKKKLKICVAPRTMTSSTRFKACGDKGRL